MKRYETFLSRFVVGAIRDIRLISAHGPVQAYLAVMRKRAEKLGPEAAVKR